MIYFWMARHSNNITQVLYELLNQLGKYQLYLDNICKRAESPRLLIKEFLKMCSKSMLAENVRLQIKATRSKAIKDKICIMFYCKLSASYQLYKDLSYFLITDTDKVNLRNDC